MKKIKVAEVKRGIAVLWESLQCPICLDLLTVPVSTKCDHQFCKFCMMKLLESRKRQSADCPVCKTKVTKRSLQDSPGFCQLVAGLQGMIHAYQQDSGLNYFTGLSQHRDISCSVDTCSEIETEQCENPAEKSFSEEDESEVESEVIHDEVARSPSSTIAAQNGFAVVMGFKDNGPTSEHDGLDSGLGDGSKSNEEAKENPESGSNAVSSLKTGRKPPHSKCEIQSSPVALSGEVESQPRRRSDRKKLTKDPEKVQEQKQKKSLEKVAEWLMKVPAEDEIEKSTVEVSNYSDSSTATLDIKLSHPNKTMQAKVLEYKVFGAVYNRGRRANRFSFPPFIPKTPVQDGPKNKTKLSDSQIEIGNEQHENETRNVVRDSCEILKKSHDKDVSPESVTHLHQPRRLSKRKHNSLQELDSDLKVPAEEEGCLPKRRRGRVAQGSKPLVLEQTNCEETIPKPRVVQAGEVQVHIENYPSSEETNTRTRRSSSRIQQVKAQDNKAPASTEKSNKSDRGAKHQNQPQSVQTLNQGNCCIFDKDLGIMEDMDVRKAKTSQDVENPLDIVQSTSSSSVDDTTTGQESEGDIVQEDRNDSEMDTELLVKSFKSAKRKSFHLGGPSQKRSCHVGENHVLINDEPEDATTSRRESAGNASQTFVRDDDSNSCDLIPPSNMEAEEEQLPVSGLGCISSPLSKSGLSPNKVSKLVVHSSPRSFVPQIGDSGLCFQAHEPHTQDASESILHSAAPSCLKEKQSEMSQKTPDDLLNLDSLTPEGLVTHDVLQTRDLPTTNHPYDETQPRQNRLSRLECSSGSEVADEYDNTEVDTEGQQNCPPTCSSPEYVQSSQASVDLFDPPVVVEAQARHNNVSMESSQFSSEVLVTQQKMEMEKDLVRLEKLIGLVTEVLQEKQDDDTTASTPAEENVVNYPDGEEMLCFPGAGQSPPEAEDTEVRNESDHLPDDAEAVASEQAVEPSIVEPKPTVKVSSKLLRPPLAPKATKTKNSFSEDQESRPDEDKKRVKMTFVTSGLGRQEQKMVKKFAKSVNACVVSQVLPEVTHVIMSTDEQLVCERTLKYFFGITGRKWVVSFHWVSESFKQNKFLDESNFEVKGDVVNGQNHLGPMRARTTADGHLLLKGFKVCFQGSFTDMTRDEMECMVEQCGAAVVKDPLSFDSIKPESKQLIIVQSQPESWSSAHSGLCKHATVVTRAWLLDTVATYTFQRLGSYTR